MKTGFKDLEGTDICIGDSIQYTTAGISPMLYEWMDMMQIAHDTIFIGKVYIDDEHKTTRVKHTEPPYPFSYDLEIIVKHCNQSPEYYKINGITQKLSVI